MSTQVADHDVAAARRPLIPVWLRNPAGLMLVVVAVFAVLSLLGLLSEVGLPFGGFASFGYLSEKPAYVAHETPDWWPALVDGTVSAGDLVYEIDGRPYSANARREFARAYAEGRPATLLVERASSQQRALVEVVVRTITLSEVIDLRLPDLTIAVVFWLLALMVLRARPAAKTNRVFATAAAAVALHRATGLTAVITDQLLWVNLLRIGINVAGGLIGGLAIYLAYVFPTTRPRRPRALLRFLCSLGLASGIGLAATRLPLWGDMPLALIDLVDDVAYTTMLVLLLAGVVALFGRLVWSWFRERQTLRQRHVAFIVLAGLITALPAVTLFVGPLFLNLGNLSTYWRGLDLRYLLLAIPITFAYVIIRYQAFQTISRLFIFVMVLSLSGLLAALGAWLWRLDVPPHLATARPPFFVLFLCVLVSGLWWSNSNEIRSWSGRFLHRESRTYDAARSFGRRVMGLTSLRELSPAMAQALVDEMDLERAAVWLYRPAEGIFELAAASGAAEPPLPGRLAAPASALDGRARQALPPDLVPPWLRPLAVDGRVEIVVPLLASGAPLGLLGLGPHWDEEIFDDRDLAVAELVGQQASLFLQASLQVEELRRVPGRVAEAQERERLRVAGELHDTIQQFLGRLPFFLAVSRNRIVDDPQSASDILDRCLTDVEEAAAMLRSIRVNLAPTQLETNLVRPLYGLISHVRQRSGLDIAVSTPEDLEDALNPQTRHALYRVIQQALDNTVAHAAATRADVMLRRENGRVVFVVRDDGHGSSAEERRAAQAAGSYGLKSMATRLEMCGGAFSFVSAPGQGTTLTGWVPAEKDEG